MKLAWVTCSRIPKPIEDEQNVIEFFPDSIHVTSVIWDDPNVDWTSFDCLIIRSVWDYFERYNAFMKWLDQIEALKVPTLNPVEVIRYNIRKNYLLDLPGYGMPIVPTQFVEPGDSDRLKQILAQVSSEIVVKPTISAGGFKTIRIKPGELMPELIEKLVSWNEALELMIQPFAVEILEEGEWSFVYFNNKFSHSANKKPKPGEFRIQEEHGGKMILMEAPVWLQNQIDQYCERIRDHIHPGLLYARIDGIVREQVFQVMELELIEPNLYLRSEPIQKRFANAIIDRVHKKNLISP